MISLGLASTPWVSLLLLLPFKLVAAAPAPIFGIGQTDSSETPQAISDDTIQTNFIRPALFTAMAYCPTSNVLAQNCGPICDQLKGIEILTAGGDNGAIPDFYVAFDPTTSAVVVAHQGTDPENFYSDLNDLEFALVDLNNANFPQAPSGAQVHDGFQATFERTSDAILSNVTAALKSKNTNKLTVVGHSLGAAIAVMDAVRLRQTLDSSVEMTTTVFGLPRGGNQDWADFVDAQLGNTLTHVSNKNDPVPTVPPRFLDFQHPSGEAHINSDDSVVSCPGQENDGCSDADSLFEISIPDHLGPYFGSISMSSSACPGS